MCRKKQTDLNPGNINLAPLRPVLNTLFMKQVPAGDAQSLCLVICFGLSKCLFGGLVSVTNRNQVEVQKSKVSCVYVVDLVLHVEGCSLYHIKAPSTTFMYNTMYVFHTAGACQLATQKTLGQCVVHCGRLWEMRELWKLS